MCLRGVHFNYVVENTQHTSQKGDIWNKDEFSIEEECNKLMSEQEVPWNLCVEHCMEDIEEESSDIVAAVIPMVVDNIIVTQCDHTIEGYSNSSGWYDYM